MIPRQCESAKALIAFIQPGQRVFVHGAAATPVTVLEALAQEHERLREVELIHLHTQGPAPYADHREFKVVSLFVGENLRSRVNFDRIDYLPCFLSEIPSLFRKNIRAPDVAILQVSPPDKSGNCSLGTSVDIARSALECAKIVLAHVNPGVPRTHGDAFFPFSKITAFWEHEEPLSVAVAKPPSEQDKAIGFHVASLIEDGATLQIGIGAVPDVILANLKGHRHLGVHTETFSDGLLPLLECGAVDNSRKVCHRNRTVTSFIAGSAALYRFVHDNPSVFFLESDYINNVANIARNPKVVALNSAVEIDLTGQVVADSVGPKIISGVGGQMDFVRGATLSKGGKAIIALPSRTRRGQRRIVPTLQPGAGVVTTRAHVHHVATEFGTVDLFGKTLGERAKALISIAHPEDRESLERAWHERLHR